ncbi:MAG: hypothetical protein EOP45_15605 [Sphingobacteriaceae bacterium]|nr:MAG: hypothetical protein EOP45_15605 [Sphingobacteriaceae bacterium]
MEESHSPSKIPFEEFMFLTNGVQGSIITWCELLLEQNSETRDKITATCLKYCILGTLLHIAWKWAGEDYTRLRNSLVEYQTDGELARYLDAWRQENKQVCRDEIYERGKWAWTIKKKNESRVQSI